MFLEELKLKNFRNYKEEDIKFINGINLYVGNNAQGKTNIIESIYLCAFGKSYRTSKDLEIINFGNQACNINLKYNKNGIKNKIELNLNNLNKKEIKKNDVKVKKISDHIDEILIVIFSPDSLDIVKGAPGKRRAFIDMICCQLSKSYLINHNEYMKCLKIKNSLLKQENIDKEYVYVLHEKMSKYIYKIVDFRKKIIKKILDKSKLIHQSLTNNKEDIAIEYISDFLNFNEEQIKKYLDEHLYIDILRKSSIKGIQRDDIAIKINDMEVSKYGSQGQNRTALLTLKLANFEVLREEKGENPVLLLDDIMSELDSNRINYLLKYIENYQSIITTTDESFVKDVNNIQISKVSNGTLEKMC